MPATVFTVAQQKGGAGKTTLAAHLAVTWTAAGKSVAVVDIDPQQSLTTWYRLREARQGNAGAGLLVNQIQGWRVRGEVGRLAREHDVVVIDSPPHAETEARVAIRASHLVIVPVQPSPMDVWATRPTLDLAAEERRRVAVVLNRVPPRAKLTEAMREELADFGVTIADSTLGNRVVFAGALAEGLAVAEVQPSGRAAREVKALAKELLRLAG